MRQDTRRRPTMLLDLPEELFVQILDLLPLRSIYQLGATCHAFHQRVNQNDHFWSRRVKTRLKLAMVDPDLGLGQEDYFNYSGVIKDPFLQGAKELYKMYSKEYHNFACKTFFPKNGKKSDMRKLLDYILGHWNSSKSDPDETSFRLGMLGPGIESRKTKQLVNRMVNAHNSCLNAVSFVPGLSAGGFGSGVRIEFKRSYIFDLLCLYTNCYKVRDTIPTDGEHRLSSAFNRLLLRDVVINGPFLTDATPLQESVLKLLPTLDGLIYAIDASSDFSQLVLKKELMIMMDALNLNVPLVILCCTNSEPCNVEDLKDLAFNLDLEEVKRPWGIFKVDIATMAGVETALSWILYHNQKLKNELKYHEQHSLQP